MLIAEVFHSLQGEGQLTGVPSVFIRTSGCNLRCQWCDTPYASWQPEGQEWEVPRLIEWAKGFSARHCVLTGGEPMIARDIHPLAAGLREEGFHLTIETAGTVAPEGIACDLASLSPKLRHSTPEVNKAGPGWAERHEKLRWQPEVLREWMKNYPFQLKFVVAVPADLVELEGLLAELDPKIPPHHVLLMPEGTHPEALARSESWLVEACLRRGFRYCQRLHIQLFGNTRGT